LAFQRLQENLREGYATILLKNTGGAAHAMSRLFEECTEARESKAVKHSASFTQKSSGSGGKYTHLLETVGEEIVSDEPWAKNFGLGDVQAMVRLYERSPRHCTRCGAG